MVDELHSHLYLKSFWCESRWAAYTPNQQTCKHAAFLLRCIYSDLFLVPRVEFENDGDGRPPVLLDSSPTIESARRTRLSRFLSELALRPNDPPHDLNDPSFRNSGSGMAVSQSSSSFSNLASTSTTQMHNPESDSFSYIETLLESLAVLGKLGSALDNVAQRLPGEIYTMVDTTLEEVSERAEYGQRGSMFLFGNGPGRSEGVYILSSGNSAPDAVMQKNGLHSASALRLVALESSAKQADHEILRDLFWSVYSKMDAVAQGLRVVYEVANRIGSVSSTGLTCYIS